MFVSVPPTQLGQPVKVWDGIAKPIGITVNTAGEIIVTEYEGDDVVLDKGGQRLRSINHSEHKFVYLLGVAVESETTSISLIQVLIKSSSRTAARFKSTKFSKWKFQDMMMLQ